MADWTESTHRTDTWTDPTVNSDPTAILTVGSPIGLLLVLTYAQTEIDVFDGTALWTEPNAPTDVWA